MANTFKVLSGTVQQLESLANLVVLLVNTHITDQETISSVTAEAQTIKQQAVEAIAAAQEAERKAVQSQADADVILSQDAQEEDLANRFSQTIDRLIDTATKALPPKSESTPIEAA